MSSSDSDSDSSHKQRDLARRKVKSTPKNKQRESKASSTSGRSSLPLPSPNPACDGSDEDVMQDVSRIPSSADTSAAAAASMSPATAAKSKVPVPLSAQKSAKRKVATSDHSDSASAHSDSDADDKKRKKKKDKRSPKTEENASKKTKSRGDKRKRDQSSSGSDGDSEYEKMQKLKRKAKLKAKAKSRGSDSDGDSENANDGEESPKKKKKKAVKEKSSAKSKSKKKKKRKGTDDEDTSSSSSGSSSSSSSDDDGPSAPVAHVVRYLAPFNPSAASARVKIPKDTNFMNPNNTMFYHSQRYGLNIHYSEIDPLAHLKISESKPKKGFNRTFCTVTAIKQQKFDFSAKGNHVRPSFSIATIVGPFGLALFPRMWPYGDRDATPGQNYAPPDKPSGVKFKLSVYNQEYSNVLSVPKANVGSVDADCDAFMNQWIGRQFEPWAKEASWQVAKTQFPVLLAKVQGEVAKEIEKQMDGYKEALEQYKIDKKDKKKKGSARKPDPPVVRGAEEMTRSAFQTAVSRSLASRDAQGFDHINFQQPVLRTQTVKERDAGTQPKLPDDQWFHDQFFSPPFWVDPKTKEEKPGYPLVPIDLPMYACITLEEALEMKKKGTKWIDPYRLIPVEERHVIHGDVCAPIMQFDKYDTGLGTGWRCEFVGLLWLGEMAGLGTHNSAPPHKDLSPDSYFLCAQKYNRGANFVAPDRRMSQEQEDAAMAAGIDAADAILSAKKAVKHSAPAAASAAAAQSSRTDSARKFGKSVQEERKEASESDNSDEEDIDQLSD